MANELLAKRWMPFRMGDAMGAGWWPWKGNEEDDRTAIDQVGPLFWRKRTGRLFTGFRVLRQILPSNAPQRAAYRINAGMVFTPSFFRMCARSVSTVLVLMFSRMAISAAGNPSLRQWSKIGRAHV